MKILAKINQWVNGVLAVAGGLTLVAMVFLTVADMVLRVFDHPLAGTYEIIGWLAAAATALALGYTQMHRGHVAINLFVIRLGPRARGAVECVNDLISLLLFAAVAWQVARYGDVLRESGSLSETLKIIVYPWVYVVAVGAAGITLALAVDFLRSAGRLLPGAQDRP
jgi:TRAP-type C4-dicarboxylate transport system permease small subunit